MALASMGYLALDSTTPIFNRPILIQIVGQEIDIETDVD